MNVSLCNSPFEKLGARRLTHRGGCTQEERLVSLSFHLKGQVATAPRERGSGKRVAEVDYTTWLGVALVPLEIGQLRAPDDEKTPSPRLAKRGCVAQFAQPASGGGSGKAGQGLARLKGEVNQRKGPLTYAGHRPRRTAA